ncbi:hypothetical protein YB2330_001258 [Saitoella coloradoensis]
MADSNRSKIITLSPIDQSPVVTREATSPSEIDKIVTDSVEAFKTYKKTSLKDRIAIAEKFLEILERDTEDAARELTQQMGRPIRYTPSEIKTMVMRGRYMISLAEKELADIDVEKFSPNTPNIRRYLRREPLGPILVISAWNYPYLIAINAVLPALLAGNTIIFKPSPQTPLCAERMAAAYHEAGLPKAAFAVIHAGDLSTVENLVKRPGVAHVCFTGSVAGGRAINIAAASRPHGFISPGLELGGKDPAYVRADADVADTAPEIVDGALFNSGQSCCSIERVYVHDAVYDEFVQKCVEEVKGYVLGDPMNAETMLGPVVSLRSAATIREHISDALAHGAKALIDESMFPAAREGSGFVAPQILVDVDHSMRVMTEETFGPVLCIQRVSSDGEAISLMNDSIFGLTASIWTANTEEGEALADEVEAGTVFVNRSDFPDPALAWTGVKESGRGWTLSLKGFDSFTRPKSFHLKAVGK